jgi:polyhydroxyalkanoate synthase
MADLQEDRSLVRNLLNLGVDLYVVDWGNPSRADRWLTLDDYIDGYLDGCVQFICEQHGLDKISLLGICEGGVFTTCYAALHPETVKNLVLTITPVDFHADASEERLGFGFINLWTRSLKPEDIDRLIEAYGNLPGEFMGSVFSMMTPMRTLTKYNLDLIESWTTRQSCSTSCAWRSGSPTARTTRARPPSSGSRTSTRTTSSSKASWSWAGARSI